MDPHPEDPVPKQSGSHALRLQPEQLLLNSGAPASFQEEKGEKLT